MNPKTIIVLVSSLVTIFAISQGFKFIGNHWADIKELLTIALVLGATFSVAVGGVKLRSGR